MGGWDEWIDGMGWVNTKGFLKVFRFHFFSISPPHFPNQDHNDLCEQIKGIDEHRKCKSCPLSRESFDVSSTHRGAYLYKKYFGKTLSELIKDKGWHVTKPSGRHAGDLTTASNDSPKKTPSKMVTKVSVVLERRRQRLAAAAAVATSATTVTTIESS